MCLASPKDCTALSHPLCRHSDALHAPFPMPAGGEGFPMVCLASPKDCGKEGKACCYNSDPASECSLGRARGRGRGR